jgi:hypothetical protein
MMTTRAIDTWIDVPDLCSFVLVDSESGNPVPKHVAVDNHHELYFMICMLLYIIECIVRWYIEYKKMHGMSNKIRH